MAFSHRHNTCAMKLGVSHSGTRRSSREAIQYLPDEIPLTAQSLALAAR